MTNKEDIYFLSTFKYRKEYQELFEFTEIKVLNICINLRFKKINWYKIVPTKTRKEKSIINFSCTVFLVFLLSIWIILVKHNHPVIH